MPIELKSGVYYSTKEAAAATSRSEGRIRQMILSRQLVAIPVGERAYLISAEEIERLKSNPPQLGRPRKPMAG